MVDASETRSGTTPLKMNDATLVPYDWSTGKYTQLNDDDGFYDTNDQAEYYVLYEAPRPENPDTGHLSIWAAEPGSDGHDTFEKIHSISDNDVIIYDRFIRLNKGYESLPEPN